LNADLVLAVVHALHPDVGYVSQWRQALQVIGGQSQAAAQVRVQDALPQELTDFTGRTTELRRLRRALDGGRQAGDAVVVAEGMAGVGKTQLVIRVGHLLAREQPFDHVLFVNLRGFHADPAQPPADPAAVLDGFLRLLGVPGQQISHDLPGRIKTYRARLADTRTLIVLDNAADAAQVNPLIPRVPGCLTLITSRHSLASVRPAAQLTVDVFTPGEAVQFLGEATAGTPAGPDPEAPARIARLCGYLPLALSLVAGHIRGAAGWTLSDHADRLDERHRHRRLETGVELALELSYQHLSAGHRRLLRLAALHPGQDLDAYAAAALAKVDVPTAEADLDRLLRDHLLQQAIPGRYTLHDLIRVYAAGRAGDEDPPSHRRTALTRLFDYYLAAAAAAMDTLDPAEAHLRPQVPRPATPTPDLADQDLARVWLDTERPTLLAVAAHTATHDWPTHTTRLAAVLYRHFEGGGGQVADAMSLHAHARHAARRAGDPIGEAHALLGLGLGHMRRGQAEEGIDFLQQAARLFQRAGDPVGQARAVANVGLIEERRGRYPTADEHYQRALALYRQAGDRNGEARCLINLAVVGERLGSYDAAVDRYEQALALFRAAGNRNGEATTLNGLGEVEARLGRHAAASEHLQAALALYRGLGNRSGEAWTLDNLGTLHTRLDQPATAAEHHRHALTIFRQIGLPYGEAWALNGLGEAARAAGRHADALTHHADALTVSTDIGTPDEQARAHAGLGHAHRALGDPTSARDQFREAVVRYTDLGMPQAAQLRTELAALDEGIRA
jgi:tetratricopeptide (TPR) repeat protein